MNDTAARQVHQAFLLSLTVGLCTSALSAAAQGVEHLNILQRGGMPGLPVVTGVERVTNGVKLSWDGPPGYYQIFRATNLGAPHWVALGPATNVHRRATITTLTSNTFFRVAGPSPRYAGAENCLECHENIHNTEMNTRHARALATLRGVGQDKNPMCLPCHTVGYGLPTGFNENDPKTLHLGGVQCENCHGPAANHAANENDPTVRPRVELAAQVCGGCHNEASHRPHFEQWATSAHFAVTEDMNPPNRINNCGRCHSGSSRLALLNGQNPAVAVANNANVGLTCVVCHDPHQTNGHPAQLRNPVFSTNDYFLSTSDNFASKYDPDINVCAQCHNHRGAAWTSSSRPPHHSPQYNMLLGTVGELPVGKLPWRAAHGTDIEKQCVGCHMQTEGGPEEAHWVMSGHSFKMTSYEVCAPCHGSAENAENFEAFLRDVVNNEMQQVRANLDRWATTRAPAEIRKYGTLAWEYDNAGVLSNPTGDPTIRGPHADSDPAKDEQKYVPANIKKARYNLYLVLHDGSCGLHNGPHALRLLDAAERWVLETIYD